MLVVKILPAKGNNFEGVAYNEKKIDEEKSNLLVANNFIGLDETANKNDYIMYFQNHSESNKKIKKPQFHASISAKGKEQSFDELVKFGKHYMKEMGYENNPYLIYKHTDTKNNHVHIVTSRVDTNGKKISDSLERVRTQKVINKYFGIDIQKKIERKIKKIDKFSFKNTAQYKLLLEKNFSKVIEKKDYISIYISDKKLDIKKSDIEKKIKLSSKKKQPISILKRKEYLKSFLLELSSKHNLKEIKLLAAKKNIHLEIFKTKDGSKNFGYSIIDEKTASVFKGSEILALKVLETNKDQTKKIENFTTLLKEIKTPKSTLFDINNELNKVGKHLDNKGVVYELKLPKKQELFRVNKSIVHGFNYNTIVKDINNKYKPLSEKDATILSFFFRIKKEDVNIRPNLEDKDVLSQRKEIANYYNYSLDFFFKNQNDIREQLKGNGIHFFKYRNEFFIVDEDKKFIGSIELNEDIKKTIEEEKLYVNIGLNKGYEKSPLENFKIENLLNRLSEHFEFTDEKENRRKKRKTQRGKTY